MVLYYLIYGFTDYSIVSRSLQDFIGIQEIYLCPHHSYQMDFVDLDEIVRTWAWTVFKAEKKDNKYQKDDLIIDINWKNTVIETDEPQYDETPNQTEGSQVS